MYESLLGTERFYLFDRDDTLVDKKFKLIHPEVLIPFFSTIQDHSIRWAIVSAGGSELAADQAYAELHEQMSFREPPIYITYNQEQTLLANATNFNNITVSSSNIITVSSSNIEVTSLTPVKQIQLILSTIFNTAPLGKSIVNYEFNFPKNSGSFIITADSQFTFTLGKTTYTVNIAKFWENFQELAAGKFKLLAGLMALDSAGFKLDSIDDIARFGFVNVNTPKNYKTILSKNVIFIDDDPKNCSLMANAGFTAIPADTKAAEKKHQTRDTYIPTLVATLPDEAKISFTSSSKDYSIISMALKGINDYIKDSTNVGGRERAELYQKALSNPKITYSQKFIILLALLTSKNGENLQHSVELEFTKTSTKISKAIKDQILQDPKVNKKLLDGMICEIVAAVNDNDEDAFNNAISRSFNGTVALLDVDDTLIFEGKRDRSGQNAILYNDILIDSLIEQGITHVYLFSDMRLTPESIQERDSLIEHLGEKGLIVHGVITPNDFAWHLDEDTIKSFDKELTKSKISLKDPNDQNKLAKLIEKFQPIQDLVRGNYTSQSFPGCAYEDAVDNISSHGSLLKPIIKKSHRCKLISDAVTASQKISKDHDKVHMLSQFARMLPDWVKNIVVVDDKKTCRDGVLKANEDFGLIVTTIDPTKDNMRGRLNRPMNDNRKEVSNLLLEHHKKVQAVQDPLEKIDGEIQRLERSNYNPFFRSSKTQIFALKKLRNAISNPTGDYLKAKTMGELIDKWKNDDTSFKEAGKSSTKITVEAVIHNHRNMFFSANRDCFTSTEEFIIRLDDNYGSIQLPSSAKKDGNHSEFTRKLK